MNPHIQKNKPTKTGQLIFDRRMELKLGQTQLAKAFTPAVSVQFISNIENGRTPLPLRKIPALAEALKLTQEQLLDVVKQDACDQMTFKVASVRG